MPKRVRVGTLAELAGQGTILTKVGSQPICVFYADGVAFAVDDRCPHLGFPLHRGHVEDGLLTCHWHHARFDLASGGTLDPFADDVRAYPVEIEADDVVVLVDDPLYDATPMLRRLHDGLEQNLPLVIAKSALGLVDTFGLHDATVAVLDLAVDFGTHYRRDGWGPGLTVLSAMANVQPLLRPEDRALALVHGLSFVARDSGGAPRFALAALERSPGSGRLASWYRRFADTRNADAAERVLATACASDLGTAALVALAGAGVTDHVFIDGGHTVDYLNKAVEMIGRLGDDRAAAVLPALARQTASASRSEEAGSWRHPDDLGALLNEAALVVPAQRARGEKGRFGDEATDALTWRVLGDDPAEIVTELGAALEQGASAEQLARAVAYAAALRLARFPTQNDHADWDVVHHAFTSANAVHQLITRAPTTELIRGVFQCAMKVYLDRFLNVPAARLPRTDAVAHDGLGGRANDDAGHLTGQDLSGLARCWNEEGLVNEAGSLVYDFLASGGARETVIAALGAALLAEDAEFHWFQTFEAAARQSLIWPERSEQSAFILVGAARFLAAHTPTRRELSQLVRIATRLRRGEALYEIA